MNVSMNDHSRKDDVGQCFQPVSHFSPQQSVELCPTRGSIVVALLSACVLFLGLPSASAAGDESGFKKIFNGSDLSGWDGNPKLWSVRDGAIVGQTTAENPIKMNTFLIWTNGLVADFELRCSFKIVPNNDKGFANSGIQYRSQIMDSNNWVVGGYQADMEAGKTYTGILYEEKMRGILAARGEKVLLDKDCQKQVTGSLGKSEDLQAAIKQGDWNDYVIIAKGNHLQHFINGKQTIDVTDECEAKRAMKGVLALQLHAGQPMTVEFRDLRMKTLGGSEGASSGATKAFEGNWIVTAVEVGGRVLSADDMPHLEIRITDGAYKLLNLDEDNKETGGTFSLNSGTEPKQIDIKPKGGPDDGRTLPGIYEANGDTMKVCYNRAGTKRPSEFSTTNDASAILITYKRKQP